MFRQIVSSVAAVLMLCVAPEIASGQSTAPDARHDQASALMTPGARIRVKLAGERAWTGTLVSLAHDSMLVRGASEGDTTLVRLSQVRALEVSAGKRRSGHLVRNTVIGLALGGGLGNLIGGGMQSGGCQKGDPCWETNWCFLCTYVTGTPVPPVTDHARAGMVIGGLAGGALGVLVSRARTEHWRPVSVTARRTAVNVSHRGAGVAIAF